MESKYNKIVESGVCKKKQADHNSSEKLSKKQGWQEDGSENLRRSFLTSASTDLRWLDVVERALAKVVEECLYMYYTLQVENSDQRSTIVSPQ